MTEEAADTPPLAPKLALSPRREGPKFLNDLMLLWTAQLVSKGVTFLAFAYLARTLSPGSYGAVEFAIGIGAFAALVIDGGIGAIGVRRVAHGEATLAQLAAFVPAAQTVIALIVAPAAWLFAVLAAKDDQAVALVSLVAFSVLLLPWKQDWLFQTAEKMGHLVAAQILRTVVFAAGIVLFVHSDRDLILAGVMEIVSVAAATLYMLSVQQLTIAPVRLQFQPAELLRLAREGMSVGLVAILWALNQYAPLLLVGDLLGMAQTAPFAAAHRLVLALAAFTWIYHFNLYPTLTRGMVNDPAALGGLTRASVRVTAWIGIGAALAATLLAKPILTLLYGPGFAVAAPAFSLLIWVFPATLISGHVRWLLVAARRERQVLFAQAAGVVLILAAGPMLIRTFGGVGGAAAMLGSCLAVWGAAQVFARGLVSGAPWRPCLLPAAAAAIVLLGVRLSDGSYVAIAIGLAVFALAMLADRPLASDLLRLVNAKQGVAAKLDPAR